MSLDPALTELQRRLLQGLADGVPLEQLPGQVQAGAEPDVRAWVQSWDPDLLELAGVLVTTWARRDAPIGPNGHRPLL